MHLTTNRRKEGEGRKERKSKRKKDRKKGGKGGRKQIHAMFILKKLVNCLEIPMLASSRKPF